MPFGKSTMEQQIKDLHDQVQKLSHEILGNEWAEQKTLKNKQELPKYVFDYQARLTRKPNNYMGLEELVHVDNPQKPKGNLQVFTSPYTAYFQTYQDRNHEEEIAVSYDCDWEGPQYDEDGITPDEEDCWFVRKALSVTAVQEEESKKENITNHDNEPDKIEPDEAVEKPTMFHSSLLNSELHECKPSNAFQSAFYDEKPIQLERINIKEKQRVDGRRRNVKFKPGDLVWTHVRKERFPTKRRPKLSQRSDGPFQILERVNEQAYKVDLRGDYGVSATLNVADLQPYYDDNDDIQSLGSNFLHNGVDHVNPVHKLTESFSSNHAHNYGFNWSNQSGKGNDPTNLHRSSTLEDEDNITSLRTNFSQAREDDSSGLVIF